MSDYKTRRLNVLAAAAFVMLLVLLAIAVFMSSLNEYAKGIVTFLLGRFAGYVDNIMSYEFGTTRGSKDKDQIINNLAAASPAANPQEPKP